MFTHPQLGSFPKGKGGGGRKVKSCSPSLYLTPTLDLRFLEWHFFKKGFFRGFR
jgi:hypothetical protein